jgi:hypothetical protein
MDPLEGAAEELSRAQVRRLEEVRLLPGADRLPHLALAIVVEPLEEERGNLPWLEDALTRRLPAER